MDLTFWTIIGTGLGVVTLVYSIIRDFRTDMDARFDKWCERSDKRHAEADSKFLEASRKFLEIDQKILEVNKRMDGVYNILLQRMGKS